MFLKHVLKRRGDLLFYVYIIVAHIDNIRKQLLSWRYVKNDIESKREYRSAKINVVT